MLAAAVIGQYSLRTLRPADAAPLALALARQPPWADLGYTAEGLQRYLNKDDAALERWVLADGASVAGVLCLRQPWLRGPFLELLCLLPDYRGQGLGGLLLAELHDRARLSGLANVWATATHSNENALRFYRRQGYEQAGVLPDLILPGVDEILLRRRLRR
ncbi:GNAT family N-acetyltransferase [Methylogaea oryzae]|uniref:N-acetyltransferase domain-containing protein n=1 Tax=Methylogaea oryzae TaxID=1295382 RepID=A0A8D4VNY3_9GAMM|nr:GNAT family N-acetyltransferase [Methylogaea oryzae]BBL71708.1 hypothetical protein MoryE10_23140 [Methylogaea oryzae]